MLDSDRDPSIAPNKDFLNKQSESENSLLRLSRLPSSIGDGIQQHPGRATALLILLLVAAGAANIARQYFVDQPVAVFRAAIDVVPTPTISLDEPGSENGMDLPVRAEDQIRQYMESHGEKFDKLWGITTTELVQIRLDHPEEVGLLDFPDPTIGQKIEDDQLEYNEQRIIPGAFRLFIAIKDPDTEDISIWAVRWRFNTNGRPIFQTFMVYFNSQWSASFLNEDGANSGRPILGEDLFGQASPSLTFPKLEPIAL